MPEPLSSGQERAMPVIGEPASPPFDLRHSPPKDAHSTMDIYINDDQAVSTNSNDINLQVGAKAFYPMFDLPKLVSFRSIP
jgi:hypothetical protein